MVTKNKNTKFNLTGHVKITDDSTGEVLLDKYNAIHPQNMARIISRGLANEDNSTFYKLAFGDGSANGVNPPNDGSVAGWQSRLYHETYSEVVDESSAAFGTDPGSSGPDNVRLGGGGNVAGNTVLDVPGSISRVYSEEAGTDSRVVLDVLINEYEPLDSLTEFGFNELGIYSSGKPALATSGDSSIFLGIGKNSETTTFVMQNILGHPGTLAGNTTFSLVVEVDGVTRRSLIRTPVGGPFTYGDVCQGINSGAWIASGSPFDFSDSNGAYFFITDDTVSYPSITGAKSSGYFMVQSKTTGDLSTITFPEEETSLGYVNLIHHLARRNWGWVNVNQHIGFGVGVINNSVTPINERERLLTHLTFPTVTKPNSTSRIRIQYTILISTADTCLYAAPTVVVGDQESV
jgi:hypothetical protein